MTEKVKEHFRKKKLFYIIMKIRFINFGFIIGDCFRYFQALDVSISTLSSTRPCGEHNKNKKKEELKNQKSTLQNQKKELRILKNWMKEYNLKIETKNHGTHSWIHFYDALLYVRK